MSQQLTFSQTSPCFYVSAVNTVGTGEIAHNELRGFAEGKTPNISTSLS